MKKIKVILLIFLVFPALTLAQEISLDETEKRIILNSYSSTSNSTPDLDSLRNYQVKSELEELRKREALYKAILENAELIQLRDGHIIDIDDLNRFPSDKIGPNSFDNLINTFRLINGGTGAGG